MPIAADRRAQFEQLEYTEDDYQKELEHIEQVILLLSLIFGLFVSILHVEIL